MYLNVALCADFEFAWHGLYPLRGLEPEGKSS